MATPKLKEGHVYYIPFAEKGVGLYLVCEGVAINFNPNAPSFLRKKSDKSMSGMLGVREYSWEEFLCKISTGDVDHALRNGGNPV